MPLAAVRTGGAVSALLVVRKTGGQVLAERRPTVSVHWKVCLVGGSAAEFVCLFCSCFVISCVAMYKF